MRLLFFFLLCPLFAFGSEKLSDQHYDFLANYCLDCHDAELEKGGVNLDLDTIDWNSPKARDLWTDAYNMLERGKMPPRKKKKQPDQKEKQAFMAFLDERLVQSNRIGGNSVHRLNQREYLNTIQDLFNYSNFKLPGSFPQDIPSHHGFDTTSKELVISPSHFEAYVESALKVADYFFPPIQTKTPKQSWEIPASDLTISYSSAYLVNGAMRLASAGSKTRNGTWPTKFEAPGSGLYKIKLDLSSFNLPKDHTAILEVKAHRMTKGSPERTLAKLNINHQISKTYEIEFDLYKGENLLFLYNNAFFNYGDKKAFPDILKQIFVDDPRLAAAWHHTKKIARGGIGWSRVKANYQDKSLGLKDIQPNTKEFDELIKKAAGKNPVLTGETLVYKYFEEGPNIGIHEVHIEGPFTAIDDPEVLRQRSMTKSLVGADSLKNVDLQKFFSIYLNRAFRRPVSDHEVQQYINLVEQEVKKGFRLEEGFHLAIRTSLMSPHFLYREKGQGPLSQHELASRLSYFLSSSPADSKLRQLADQAKLNDSKVLRGQVERYLKSSTFRKKFIQDFTAQWLDTDLLNTIMPDPTLFKKFKPEHVKAMVDEVVLSFEDILMNNRSMEEFIDPDFIFTNDSIGKEIYQLKKLSTIKKGKISKVNIERGTRQGGLLSMPAVMMATANGVDTQPVVRGVWMLENILGTPPPAPPKNVPALPPDTRGTKGPREKLAAHMDSESCASCHDDIDPMGFIFENFDPVGRWREEYPAKRDIPAFVIDASTKLSDGTKFEDITDLKAYLIKNPQLFNTCLAEKLMTYGTGRELNYREKKLLKSMVNKSIQNGQHFKDLLLDLIDSELFRSR